METRRAGLRESPGFWQGEKEGFTVMKPCEEAEVEGTQVSESHCRFCWGGSGAQCEQLAEPCLGCEHLPPSPRIPEAPGVEIPAFRRGLRYQWRRWVQFSLQGSRTARCRGSRRGEERGGAKWGAGKGAQEGSRGRHGMYSIGLQTRLAFY